MYVVAYMLIQWFILFNYEYVKVILDGETINLSLYDTPKVKSLFQLRAEWMENCNKKKNGTALN
jgi:hypothetical protein